MDMVTLRAAFCAATLALLLAGCPESTPEPCSGVDCSGHGECRHVGLSVWCQCDPGYRARGLDCLLQSVDGDGDGDFDEDDRDADSDEDLETEVDADSDPDPDPDPDVPPDLTIEDSFDDFNDGTFPGSLANLYVAADGTIRSIHATDLTGNGAADVVVANNFDGSDFDIPSYIYEGPFERGGAYSEPAHQLPTEGAGAAVVADIDADGALDVLFGNVGIEHAMDFDVGSPIYWGPDFDPESPTVLESIACNSPAVADLDRDGYLDLILNASFFFTYCADSIIHWGSEAGFTRSSTLETLCPEGTAVADLDGDGHLDLIFANAIVDLDGFDTPSYIYWGDGTRMGFRDEPEHRSEIDTYNASDVSVADLDGDGLLDLIFSQNRVRPGEERSHAEIYWAVRDGDDERPRYENGAEPLVGTGINVLSVADLDGEAGLDVIVANYNWPAFVGPSSIYWGPGDREGWGMLTNMETVGGRGIFVADYDLDGAPDIFFSSFQNGAAGEIGRQIDSYIYFGPNYLQADRASLATMGARESRHLDLGNVADRGRFEMYLSSVMELSDPPARIWWSAETPHHTSVRFQVRGGSTELEALSAEWLGPSSSADWYTSSGDELNAAHADHGFVQYRVRFDLGDHRDVVVLDWVGLENYP